MRLLTWWGLVITNIYPVFEPDATGSKKRRLIGTNTDWVESGTVFCGLITNSGQGIATLPAPMARLKPGSSWVLAVHVELQYMLLRGI